MIQRWSLPHHASRLPPEQPELTIRMSIHWTASRPAGLQFLHLPLLPRRLSSPATPQPRAPWRRSTREGCLQLMQVGKSFLATMQYIMHRVQAPITIGDLLPGLPSDDTHELGDDDESSLLPSPPSTSILPPGGGDRCSCSSSLAPLAPPLLPPLLMVAGAGLHCTAKINSQRIKRTASAW